MQLGKVGTRGRLTLPRDIRQAAGLKPGDVVAFEVTASGRVELRALPRLTLAKVLARYRIERPIDETSNRLAWQRRAAQDVIGG